MGIPKVAAGTTSSEVGDLASHLRLYERHLRAQNRAEPTIYKYTLTARQLIEFLTDTGMPTQASAVTREHVEAFIEHTLTVAKASTAATRYQALRVFFNFLIEEGEITASPMARMHPPIVPEQQTPVVADDELEKLLATCSAKTLTTSGTTRSSDSSSTPGADSPRCPGCRSTTWTRRRRRPVLGKNRRPRVSRSGTTPPPAIERYLSERRKRAGDEDPLWLGLKGPMTAERHPPDGPAPVPAGRARADPPAPVETHLRPPVARERRQRAGPDAHRRVADPDDVEPVRGEHRRPACPRGPQAPQSRRPAVTRNRAFYYAMTKPDVRSAAAGKKPVARVLCAQCSKTNVVGELIAAGDLVLRDRSGVPDPERVRRLQGQYDLYLWLKDAEDPYPFGCADHGRQHVPHTDLVEAAHRGLDHQDQQHNGRLMRSANHSKPVPG